MVALQCRVQGYLTCKKTPFPRRHLRGERRQVTSLSRQQVMNPHGHQVTNPSSERERERESFLVASTCARVPGYLTHRNNRQGVSRLVACCFSPLGGQHLCQSLRFKGYRGTSLKRKRTHLGPYRKPVPRVLGPYRGPMPRVLGPYRRPMPRVSGHLRAERRQVTSPSR